MDTLPIRQRVFGVVSEDPTEPFASWVARDLHPVKWRSRNGRERILAPTTGGEASAIDFPSCLRTPSQPAAPAPTPTTLRSSVLGNPDVGVARNARRNPVISRRTVQGKCVFGRMLWATPWASSSAGKRNLLSICRTRRYADIDLRLTARTDRQHPPVWVVCLWRKISPESRSVAR